MLSLNSKITDLPKIGFSYSKFLENIGIFTIRDLLYHIPTRYESFDEKYTISTLKEGSQVSFIAEIISIDNIFLRSGKRMTKAKVRDQTGKIDLIWFNQTYLSKTLKIGDYYRFMGKVGTMGGKLNLVSPKFEKTVNPEGLGFLAEPKTPALPEPDNSDHRNLIAIYPETKGITSKFLSQKIKYALENILLEDPIPQEFLTKYGFFSIKETLMNLHFPETKEINPKNYERLSYEELLLELIKVGQRKKIWKDKKNSFEMRDFSNKINLLEKSLPFTLTPSQKEAVLEIFSDLQKPHPMNRLLEGDVGTGKTLVAVFASYLTFLNNYKTVYLAPTEILAKQHFETFKKFLEPMGVKVVLKTASSKTKLKETDFDICIGTHAILFDYKHLQNLALVIIDEQHRFGVEQRSKILGIYEHQTTPNLLTMTATPIPRTLALTLYGELEISVLKTPPNINKKITTYVIYPKKRDEMYAWIASKNEQAFIVCPFVNQSEYEDLSYVKSAIKEYEELSKGVFKNLSVGLLHGKLKPQEKQDILNKFKNKEFQILVSTPVIEVGVDIPEASIIVIESAERYGLASLHQLRGRVGRGEKEGFCVVIPSHSSKSAYERLKNLEKVHNGLELAEIDLKLRGEGDVTGLNQSGFKNFKFASLGDLTMLENTKKDADRILNDLQKYPKLEELVTSHNNKEIGNN